MNQVNRWKCCGEQPVNNNNSKNMRMKTIYLLAANLSTINLEKNVLVKLKNHKKIETYFFPLHVKNKECGNDEDYCLFI